MPVRVCLRCLLVILISLLWFWFGGKWIIVCLFCKCTLLLVVEVLVDRVEIEILFVVLFVEMYVMIVCSYFWLCWCYGEYLYVDYCAVVFWEGGELVGLVFCWMWECRGLVEVIVDDVLVCED